MTYDAPVTPPPLGPGLLQVIRASADRLIDLEDEFIRQLQYELATLIPDSAGLRDTGGWAFCERMARTLLWAAVTDQPPDVVADTLRQLGARNWLDGFSESQYVSVVHALVRAVRDLCADDWSSSMSSAWISYFMWIKPYLMLGAQQAAAQQAAIQRAANQQAAVQQAINLAQTAEQDSGAGYPQAPAGDADLESEADLLEDEDDEDYEADEDDDDEDAGPVRSWSR
jgi:hypothetical protein